MHASISASSRGSRLIAGAALLALLALPREAAAQGADAFPSYESYIRITGQNPWITGNGAAFQTKARTPENGSAGIEDLHIYKDLSRTEALQVDGRALAGAEDYLAHVNYLNSDVGTVDVGYKRFRTFYDGVGGFFPINQQWLPLADQELHVDRGRFWAEVHVALPDRPVFDLKYSNETRAGMKDSTTWASSNLTGLSSGAARKILPDLMKINERHQILQGSLKGQIGNTSATLTVIGDKVNNEDTRTYTNNLGESSERTDHQTDIIETRSFITQATTETVFNDQFTLNTGWSYRHVVAEVGGERTDNPLSSHPHSFYNLQGGTTGNVVAANASLSYRPSLAWYWQLAVRAENNRTNSKSEYDQFQTKPTEHLIAASHRKDRVVTPELDVRYTGFQKLVIYAMARSRIDRADLRNIEEFDATLSSIPSVGDQAFDDLNQQQSQYLLGANWNYSPMLTLRGEVYVKDHENRFDGVANEAGARYVLGYNYTGFKFTAIVKPIPQLTLTTRYVPQWGKMEVTTESTNTFESMRARTHLIGETIDWNPTEQMYVQGNLNVGFDYIGTAYPDAGTPPTIAPQRNSDNNYLVESLVAGFVVTKQMDIQVIGTHQHAHNYQPELATGTVPYGAGYSESTGSVAIKYLLSENMIGTAKFGYVESRNETTGGNTNFRGPMAYLSVEYGL